MAHELTPRDLRRIAAIFQAVNREPSMSERLANLAHEQARMVAKAPLPDHRHA